MFTDQRCASHISGLTFSNLRTFNPPLPPLNRLALMFDGLSIPEEARMLLLWL